MGLLSQEQTATTKNSKAGLLKDFREKKEAAVSVNLYDPLGVYSKIRRASIDLSSKEKDVVKENNDLLSKRDMSRDVISAPPKKSPLRRLVDLLPEEVRTTQTTPESRAITGFLKETAQGFARDLGGLLAAGKTITPETPTERAIFGDQPFNLETVGRSYADIVGKGEEIDKRVAVGIGVFAGFLSIPLRAGGLIKESSQIISKLDDAALIKNELKRLGVQANDFELDSFANVLKNEPNPTVVENILGSMVRETPGSSGLLKKVDNIKAPTKTVTPLKISKNEIDTSLVLKAREVKKSGRSFDEFTANQKSIFAVEGRNNTFTTAPASEGVTQNKSYIVPTAKILDVNTVPEGVDPKEFATANDFDVIEYTDNSGQSIINVLNQDVIKSEAEITSLWEKADMPASELLQKNIKPLDNNPAFQTPTDKNSANIEAYKDARGVVARSKDWLLEQIQDDMRRVRVLTENKNLKITEQSNPYAAEILFHGRIDARITELKQKTIQIDKEIVSLSKEAGIKPEEFTKNVNEYLIARHAPERNSALNQERAAGISTSEATAKKAEIESSPIGKDVVKVANKIQDLNNDVLDILKEGEIITDELYDTLRNRYKYHIPLLRVFENEPDFAGAIATGFDIKSTGIRRAKGSEREVADILGNVVFNYEQALIRSEKNRVDLATLAMVRDNKEAFKDLFSIRKPRVIGESWDGRPITETVTDPQTLVMREKGKVVLIRIEDPHMAVALRGVGRHKLTGIMRGVGAITRFYAGIHTRFNPEFAFSNKIRDIQEAIVFAHAQSEIGTKGAAKIALRETRLQNQKAVIDFILGKDSEGARLYKEMMMEGGTTGGMGLSTRAQVELDIDAIRKINRSNPRKAAAKLLEYIENWNKIFEDSTRLSVYRQALEGGASKQRAALMAKDASVNFNKFGKQGQIVNALWIFANASIQGTTKTLRALKNPKTAATVATAIGGSVAAVSEWNDSIDPDWRNKITTWDRLNNFAIMLPSTDDSGDVRYITIPVAWGIKPIKVMAEEFYDLTSGEGDGVIESTKAILVSILEAYNPVGGSDIVSAITPTVLDLANEIRSNISWNGGPIRPDWDRNAPDSIRYFDSLKESSTGRTAIAISKGASGIGIEVSPANIHYAYESLIGGAGKAASRIVNSIVAVGSGEVPPTKEIPVVNRFYKTRANEEIGAGTQKFQEIAEILEEQSRERFYLSQQAEDSLQQLKNVPPEEGKKIFMQIKDADPDLAKEILRIDKEEQKGLTYTDRRIMELGVENGQRARFLKKEFEALETKEEKRALWIQYREKGIISDTVEAQLNLLFKQ